MLALLVLAFVLRLRCNKKPTCPNSKQKCRAHRYSLIAKIALYVEFDDLGACG